jgi:ketosteroid isomerase-like protein
MADHLTTVTSIYEAFGRGDIPFILDQMADDVQWDQWAAWSPHQEGVSWLAPRQGKAGVREFFEIIGTWTFTAFEIRGVLAGGNQVGAELVISVEMPASGARLQDEEFHLWTFNDAGKVTRFRHYVDTAKHIAAAQGAGVAA